MLSGLDINSYNLKIFGNGLQLTGTTVKGKGCNIKYNKKRILKNKLHQD